VETERRRITEAPAVRRDVLIATFRHPSLLADAAGTVHAAGDPRLLSVCLMTADGHEVSDRAPSVNDPAVSRGHL
jgi:hypothetical protein